MRTMMTNGGTLAAAALAFILGFSAPARAEYVFTRIDVPGATLTFANGNSPHAIGGEFDDQGGTTHGFVLSGGIFTPFDAPDADGYTSINGINARGERAGIYFANNRFYGYVWSRGSFTTLDPPDSIFSAALFLNGHGEVVGYSVDAPTRTRHGFVWSKGVFTTLDVPEVGRGGTVPSGINDHGEIVGRYADKNGHIRGFLLSHGAYTTLDVPGSESGLTIAQGINDAGQIAGFYDTGDGASHGFVLSHGQYTTVDVPGAFWTEIYSIDAKGELVGTYEDAGGIHGFRATPAR